MLGLFKEQERQLRLDDIRRKNKYDQAMQEHFQNVNKKDKFNDSLLRGEKMRNNLKEISQTIQNKRCKDTLNVCENSLGRELGERKLNTHREEKIRQLLWETTPELRELRQKLHIAGVTKDQAMQIAEKQALLDLKREEKVAETDALRREIEAMEAEERKKEVEELRARRDYHKDLDELRKFKQEKDAPNEEELERERKAIDDIKKKIEEEQLKLAQHRLEKQKELQQQAQELQRVRNEIRTQERMKDKAQDLKADEYRKAQELRAKELEEKKQLSLENRLGLQEELLSCLEKMCSDKLRKETLRTELAVEEKDAIERKKENEADRKRIRIREELQQLYEMQMRVKRQKEDLQKKEEELYRQHLMSKLYEEDKLELMSQQKRHRKKLEHMRVAQSMIEEIRKKKEMERAKEMADQKYQEQLESERIQMINNEKMRFLKDHASELLGYLPKGVFKDDETIELLGNEFKTFYARPNFSK